MCKPTWSHHNDHDDHDEVDDDHDHDDADDVQIHLADDSGDDDDDQIARCTLVTNWLPEGSKAKGENISHDVLYIAWVPEQRRPLSLCHNR